MGKSFELHYDVVCPYAYLASTQIEALAERCDATIEWKPFLLGGVFRSIGGADDPNAVMPEPKAAHNQRDMRRWAERFGVPLVMHPEHPRRSVLALRALLAAGEESRVPATHALFAAYWKRGEDIADPEVVAHALSGAGLDGVACVERASEPAIKDDLRARTDAAVAAGVFGAPTFIVDGELVWGQDRLHFLEAILRDIPLREAARQLRA
ncbi:MAG: 2-hydroxychromene-2-carboxylate isomerase [Deltaproteobacteria bacterium]|nr:2-hydroxychromene-2-carboxylate isomerase [Deltaproteobacteria bacterium]